MTSTAELLDRVLADLDTVLSDDGLAALSDPQRVTVLQVAGAVFRRAEAVVVETIASGDLGDLPHAAGCRGMNELLQRTLRIDARAAVRVDRVVERVRRPLSLAGERMPARWPELRSALLDGAIGVTGFLAASGPIEHVWDRLTIDQRLATDIALAGAARGYGLDSTDDDDLPPDPADDESRRFDDGSDATGPAPTAQDLSYLAQDLASMFDPDGEEPKDDEACRRRGITLGRLHDGMHAIRGYLTPDAGAQLQLILDAILNPKVDGAPLPGVRFTADESPAGAGDDDPFNSDPRAVLDDRTAAQKRHDALAAALGIAARHRDMPTLGGASPVLVVMVEANDLAAHAAVVAAHAAGVAPHAPDVVPVGTSGRAEGAGNGGWATIPGSGAHLPVSVAAQAGCHGAIQRVLMDEGRVVAITTTDRVFTVHQRRAIIARDKECLIPGCHVPASWCEIHHVTEHAKGGATHTDNGVPLCWWHHRSLGTSGWEIRMHDGVPQVRGPEWWDPDQRWRTPRLSAQAALRVRRRVGRSQRDSAPEPDGALGRVSALERVSTLERVGAPERDDAPEDAGRPERARDMSAVADSVSA
ncbi:DUF222 domain-containing protein [Microbacterium sp. ANT_H45B]|uniref:HNH endonuclease signature motif containing protein n=1 Tax=Microbacterium sp. ANT_H45B TaxID=2597346 RepID=UPI0011EF02C7|nr:HNH endonuclease signature motif containing protein [Microbacterium sp. ANT_H45B]KAA0960205.1 DUF222 domain-containing protein [Microbacterium sp. ANT_H45B]